MTFALAFAKGVKEDWKGLRAYDRRIVLEAIEAQLRHAPHVETKQRKLVHNLAPPFEAIPPIWQLRVGAFRVFYDVNEEERRVYVRAIRRKPAHLKTEEIL
jgi:mRNA-degrading endonuclease RelE of RelBE toxin-antitoxin system